MWSRDPRSEVFRRLRRAQEFMEGNCANELTVDQISKIACFSQYHFLRKFREVYQETPHQFLTKFRIEQAKRLLKSENQSVTDICFEVGFQSLGSFSALFRKLVGSSPSEFRRQHNRIFMLSKRDPIVLVPSCFASMFAPQQYKAVTRRLEMQLGQ